MPADTIWIAHHLGAGRNVYFEVNETPARCAKKLTKDMMLAAGLERVQVFNLTAGVAALHEGVKL